ncbi:MAG TPA: c-type cytochrome [Candidatus Sulfotelmatobacter sp.]|nr:c-type cytochrome [Candidatus Sulfotelmatobacter sp.]
MSQEKSSLFHSTRARFFAGTSFGLAVVACFLCAALAAAQAPPRPLKKGDKTAAPATPTTPAEVARGKYIVENVAMCPQCHTPRDGNGALDHAHELQGAAEFFQPPHPDANWPLKAPRIGGDPPANDQDMIKLLTTGIWTDGKPLRLPMMPFRMSEADAKAVLAYLKTVRQEH